MISEMIRRQTAEEICAHRDEALRLFSEALHVLNLAQQHADKSVEAGHCSYWLSNIFRRSWSGDLKARAEMAEMMTKKLDAKVWRSLFLRTGLGDLFDTQQREEFEANLNKSPAPVSIENVVSTMFYNAATQRKTFERSIQNLFKQLSRSHKSNTGFSFGHRMIFTAVFTSFCHDWRDTVRDLERAVLTLDGAQVPGRNDGLISRFTQASGGLFCSEAGELDDEYFEFRWFKNGNLHVRIKSKHTIQKLNKIIEDETTLGKNPR